MSKQINFIDKIKDGAIASMRKHGVLASITIAQAILESSWGESGLSKNAFNLFGIKATSNEPFTTMRTAEYTAKREKYYINAKFRKYSSYSESIEDHAMFLVENPRYKSCGLFNTTEYKGQANALVKAGYATDPNYANLLIQLIEQYGLNKYDAVSTKKYAIDYCLEWQQFYNRVTQTKAPLRTDGDYGSNTQKSLEALYSYIKEGKKYKYCLGFQRFYNQATKTKAPITEDGAFGTETEKAFKIMEKLIKGEY